MPRAATLLAAPGLSGGHASNHDTPEEGHVKSSTVIRTASAAVAATFLIACGTGTTPGAEPSASPTSGTVIVTAPQSAEASPSAAPASTKPAPAAPATFTDGVWRVPEEVKPGTYRTVVPADSWNCYYEVKRNFDSKLDSIIDNGNQEPTLPQIITIPKTAKGVEVSGCGTWTKIK